MESPLEVLSLTAALVALCATVLLIIGLRVRSGLHARIARLEDALRVYNSANAEIGRQLRAMEERLLLAAATPLARAPEEAPAPRGMASFQREDAVPVLRSLAALAPRAAAMNPAPRPGATARVAAPKPEAGDETAGPAERRLAELLRSRLPASGALQ